MLASSKGPAHPVCDRVHAWLAQVMEKIRLSDFFSKNTRPRACFAGRHIFRSARAACRAAAPLRQLLTPACLPARP